MEEKLSEINKVRLSYSMFHTRFVVCLLKQNIYCVVRVDVQIKIKLSFTYIGINK